MRTRLARSVIALLLIGATGAVAQDYLLPEGPGKSLVTGACETCHGIITVAKHKRSPHQWEEIVHRMVAMGAPVDDAQSRVMMVYLNTNFGQEKDFVPLPMALHGRGPSFALALEAAETAQETCRAKGYRVATLVVDSVGSTIVLLTGDGADAATNAIAATKTATVLKYKVSSGTVMKRMESDPVLVAEAKNDPAIGEVRQGGLPITVGRELIGAIAVSGDFGPVDKDEICAKAGLDRIASRLR